MDELRIALSYPGMTLEIFHHHGAPAVAELQKFVDGDLHPNDAQIQQMAQALTNIRASGRREF